MRKEQKLDETLKKLEEADDDELERLREKRLHAMQQKAQELRAQGHGEYTTIADTQEFFETAKKSEKVVVHFFTRANAFCQVVDGHLNRLALHHVETKFARMDAEKAEYVVDKLGV
ncbi:hypothetical protein PsorP6_006909 [Peronosclerospora sorghi]|uniref:Uncharacterized protein n=1 Tax=Peronosclerospora sorghi TaxID=230839 RepID=A0ACC0WBE5_9STRA|nr:hypothetical protein PsorP6_006909 [Peronosclerospora sorghi]